MKIVKAGLLVVLVVVVLLTGTSVANARGLIKTPPWISTTINRIKTAAEVAAPIPPAMSEQVTVLSERMNGLGGHSGKVLSGYIQETPERTPVYEKTIDYARYIYCQQAIREYDQKYSAAGQTAPASPASPVMTASPSATN